jgi:hypothetical protein
MSLSLSVSTAFSVYHYSQLLCIAVGCNVGFCAVCCDGSTLNVCNKVLYVGTLFGRLILVFDVFINNGATVQFRVSVQWHWQYSSTMFCLFDTN